MCLHHRIQQALRAVCIGAMPRNTVIDEGLQSGRIGARGKVLKRANPDMAGRHTRQDRARKGRFAQDRLAGGDSGQRTGGGHSGGVHELAHHILAQHGAKPGAAIAHPAIGRWARAFELDVMARHFPKQDRAAIAQLGVPVAELMARIDLRQRIGHLWYDISSKNSGFRRAFNVQFRS